MGRNRGVETFLTPLPGLGDFLTVSRGFRVAPPPANLCRASGPESSALTHKWSAFCGFLICRAIDSAGRVL